MGIRGLLMLISLIVQIVACLILLGMVVFRLAKWLNILCGILASQQSARDLLLWIVTVGIVLSQVIWILNRVSLRLDMITRCLELVRIELLLRLRNYFSLLECPWRIRMSFWFMQIR
jgi:hypothetical protein